MNELAILAADIEARVESLVLADLEGLKPLDEALEEFRRRFPIGRISAIENAVHALEDTTTGEHDCASMLVAVAGLRASLEELRAKVEALELASPLPDYQEYIAAVEAILEKYPAETWPVGTGYTEILPKLIELVGVDNVSEEIKTLIALFGNTPPQSTAAREALIVLLERLQLEFGVVEGEDLTSRVEYLEEKLEALTQLLEDFEPGTGDGVDLTNLETKVKTLESKFVMYDDAWDGLEQTVAGFYAMPRPEGQQSQTNLEQTLITLVECCNAFKSFKDSFDTWKAAHEELSADWQAEFDALEQAVSGIDGGLLGLNLGGLILDVASALSGIAGIETDLGIIKTDINLLGTDNDTQDAKLNALEATQIARHSSMFRLLLTAMGKENILSREIAANAITATFSNAPFDSTLPGCSMRNNAGVIEVRADVPGEIFAGNLDPITLQGPLRGTGTAMAAGAVYSLPATADTFIFVRDLEGHGGAYVNDGKRLLTWTFAEGFNNIQKKHEAGFIAPDTRPSVMRTPQGENFYLGGIRIRLPSASSRQVTFDAPFRFTLARAETTGVSGLQERVRDSGNWTKFNTEQKSTVTLNPDNGFYTNHYAISDGVNTLFTYIGIASDSSHFDVQVYENALSEGYGVGIGPTA